MSMGSPFHKVEGCTEYINLNCYDGIVSVIRLNQMCFFCVCKRIKVKM